MGELTFPWQRGHGADPSWKGESTSCVALGKLLPGASASQTGQGGYHPPLQRITLEIQRRGYLKPHGGCQASQELLTDSIIRGSVFPFLSIWDPAEVYASVWMFLSVCLSLLGSFCCLRCHSHQIGRDSEMFTPRLALLLFLG